MSVDLPEQAYAAALASTASRRSGHVAQRPGRGPARRRVAQALCLARCHRARRPAGLATARRAWHRRGAGRRRRPTPSAFGATPRPRPCCSVSAILSPCTPRPRWRWSGPARRRATGSASPRSSGPIWPPPGSASSRASRSGSTARPTRAPAGRALPPVGVVAGGLDKPYPARHARLWQRVAEHGAVVSESPAGVRTERWRFPVRNRLLAALSDVVIVIESRHHGGARHTVDAAAALGIPVGAVPGSIRSATSEGTNALLADGAFPACSTADILVALSLVGVQVSPPAGIRRVRGLAPTERRRARARIGPSTRPCPATPPPWTTWSG